MISRAPAAPYDSSYYYAVGNRRHRASVRRAALLVDLAADDLIGTRCLDFGCNDGSFAATLTARGYACVGVDINESMLKFASSFGDAEFRRPEDVHEDFEILTAFDVIEHFDAPGEFFAAIDRYLKPTGRLIVTTPNKNSKWRDIYGAGWHGYGIPQYHRLLISEKFLRTQFEFFGYKIDKLLTVPPIESLRWRLLFASGYRLHVGKLRKIAALPGSALKLVAGSFVNGEEDTIYATARKVSGLKGLGFKRTPQVTECRGGF
jgi:SAM-dependent methyltransferase